MWWAGSRPYDLYLGDRAVSLCDGEELRLSLAVDHWEAGLAAAREELARRADRRRVRVWLSGALCRPCVLPALQGLRNRAEMLKVAQALAGEKTGFAGPCRVWLERGAKRAVPMAAAVDVALLERLTKEALGRRLASITPWWAEALNTCLRGPHAPQAIAVRDSDALTVLAGPADEFGFAATYFPAHGRDAAAAAFARAMLSADLPAGPRSIWSLGSAPVGQPVSCALGVLVETWT